jgi:hypothetical protein
MFALPGGESQRQQRPQALIAFEVLRDQRLLEPRVAEIGEGAPDMDGRIVVESPVAVGLSARFYLRPLA